MRGGLAFSTDGGLRVITQLLVRRVGPVGIGTGFLLLTATSDG